MRDINSLTEMGILTAAACIVFILSVYTGKKTGFATSMMLLVCVLAGADYMAFTAADAGSAVMERPDISAAYFFRSMFFSLNSWLTVTVLAFSYSTAPVKREGKKDGLLAAAAVYALIETLLFIATPFTGIMFTAGIDDAGAFKIESYSLLFFLHVLFMLIMAGFILYTYMFVSAKASDVQKLLNYTVVASVALACMLNTFTMVTSGIVSDMLVLVYIIFGMLTYALLRIINTSFAVYMAKEEAFDEVDNQIMLYDNAHKLVEYNSSAVMTFGIDSQDSEAFDEVNFVRNKLGMDIDIQDLEDSVDYEVVTHIGGARKFFILNVNFLEDYSGKAIGRLYMMNDVTRIREISLKLDYSTSVDPLTGLYNKQKLEQVAAELDRTENYPISIAYADINGLREICEVMGIEMGDNAIKAMVDIAEEICREDFVLGSVGSSIVILMPRIREATCVRIMDSIKDAVSRQSDFVYPISIEYGVFEKNSEYEDMTVCMREAYDTMLRKKMLNPQSPRYSLVRSMVSLNEDLSHSSFGHAERVTRLSEMMCSRLGLSDSEKSEIRLFAMLHYVGMFAVPTRIITKSEPLTEDEWTDVKENSEKGYKLINMLGNLTALSPVSTFMLALHEYWDGTGYPNGLKGEEIPLPARLVALISAFDTMIHDSYYKKGRSIPDALEEIKNCGGTQFDPELADKFIEMIKEEGIVGVESLDTLDKLDNMDYDAGDFSFFEVTGQ